MHQLGQFELRYAVEFILSVNRSDGAYLLSLLIKYCPIMMEPITLCCTAGTAALLALLPLLPLLPLLLLLLLQLCT